MVFSSPFFLFLFLPLVIVFYYLSPKKLRNLVLLIASYLFYYLGSKDFFFIFIFSTLLDFFLSLGFKGKHKKSLLIIGLAFNLSLLGFYKYYNFFAAEFSALLGLKLSLAEVVLPLGISFFTFQKISYLIDTYRGKSKVIRNFINYALYISLFPQLIAGPIIRFEEISDQITSRKHSYNKFNDGIYEFILGLAMKVIIADPLGKVHQEVFANQIPASSSLIFIGILAYTFQIYFDFAGYSKMAIGIGKLFGFTFPENFNRPYLSRSITEFWRRWHMTLSGFLKEYVYFPLGGSRVNRRRLALNLFIVFLLTGIWHGANWTFFIWGIYFGIFIILEKLFYLKYLEKIPNVFSRLITFSLVFLSWILFQANSISDAFITFKNLISFNDLTNLSLVSLNFKSIFILFLATLLSFAVIQNKKLLLISQKNWFKFSLASLLLVYSILQVAGSTYHPFLYFRF